MPPTSSSRKRARSSKKKTKSRSPAPKALLLQRHIDLSDAQRPAHGDTARAHAASGKAATGAAFRGLSDKCAVAAVDDEAALGATFGRPPTATEDNAEG